MEESELDAAVRLAWAAHQRADWLDAIVHWRTCIRLSPTMANAYWMSGALLLGAGQLDEAEVTLSAGVKLDPGNVLMAVEHARAATALKDWPAAIDRWNALAERAPDAPEVIKGRGEAEAAFRLHLIDQGIGDAAVGPEWRRFGSRATAAADTELFKQFESLGDNCEFGLVQRHFGAEPLSLLRWNSISIGPLITGIADGFVGVGDKQHTSFGAGQHDEYVLHEHRYGMAMHTFIKPNHTNESAEQLHDKMCQRLAYLRTKFVEDPSRVFVYKALAGTTLDKVIELHSAMELYAPNRLLYVVDGDTGRAAGSVEEIRPGLFVGAVNRFVRDGATWDTIDFEGWRTICCEVWERGLQSSSLPPGGASPATADVEGTEPPSAVNAVASGATESHLSSSDKASRDRDTSSWDILRGSAPLNSALDIEPEPPKGFAARMAAVFRRKPKTASPE